ncbi:histidine phosphatase family protein [Actinocorallia longicatena]|uniref:Histidine phosphatase family protein n=1 Tax=Actinocorallia longicatena TaxID=111803 RepID=A0ABP6QHK4_9ACTN
MGDRYLYVARHAEATEDGTGLTGRGRRQGVLLGRRLRDVPLSVITHGPLPRAAQTAEAVRGELDGVPAMLAEEAGDYVPHIPAAEDLPEEFRELFVPWLAKFSAAEVEHGDTLVKAAMERFTGPVEGDEPRHELLVTHAWLAAWLVRAATDAPAWRWLGLHPGNAALTVIRYSRYRPASLRVYNDMTHLPEDLRWTGFPAELQSV